MRKKILAKIRDKGEITIPKEIREKLGWSPEDYLKVVENDDGSVCLRKLDF